MAAIHANMPMTEYAALPGWNYSAIKHGRRSMAHARHAADDKGREQSDAMLIGEALHCWLLERDRWDKRFLVADVPDLRTKLGKEEFGALLTVAGTRSIISVEQAELVRGMARRISMHPRARELRDMPGKTELVITWDDPSGLRCKARLDKMILDADAGIIVDIKTTKNASDSPFGRDAANYGYPLQAAMYERACSMAGIAIQGIEIIAVENEPPHAVNVFQVTQQQRDYFGEVLNALLLDVAACEKSGKWPGYDTAPRPLALPGWATAGMEVEV
jgi:hypothetical protein